jgi:hypothetical protein
LKRADRVDTARYAEGMNEQIRKEYYTRPNANYGLISKAGNVYKEQEDVLGGEHGSQLGWPGGQLL